MTAVPLGKLQHKVSYLVNSGGCKMCVDPLTQFHMIFSSGTPGTSYTHQVASGFPEGTMVVVKPSVLIH